MTYDAMGDILTWQADGASVNTLNYTAQQSGCSYYANSQLHAARNSTQSTWSTSKCYDANGNLLKTSTNGSLASTYTWTSYNQPNGITGGSNSSSQFFYDANHQRWKQVASYSGASETTTYIGGLLEKVVTSAGTAYRHYVPAGGDTVLYMRWSTGSNPTYYITRDHLGSSSVVSDASGNLYVNESFATLGWRRGDSWTGGPTSAETTAIGNTTRRGFTGQEMLDNVWVVNMNGRIYNAAGQFISPDPYVPDPANTQSFNRYSYVINNPLTYTDPSGFDWGGVTDPVYIPTDNVTITAQRDIPVPQIDPFQLQLFTDQQFATANLQIPLLPGVNPPVNNNNGTTQQPPPTAKPKGTPGQAYNPPQGNSPNQPTSEVVIPGHRPSDLTDFWLPPFTWGFYGPLYFGRLSPGTPFVGPFAGMSSPSACFAPTRSGNQNLQRNTSAGAGAGSLIGIGAGLLIANAIGFPQVEGAEAAGALLFMGRAAQVEGVFIRAAAMDNVTAPASLALRSGAVGGTVGGATGFAFTPGACP